MWVTRWQRRTGNRIDFAPYQLVASDYPEVPRERFQAAAQLVDTDGRVFSGAAAVLRALSHAGRRRWLWSLYSRLALFAWFSEWVYRLVAGHRRGLTALTRFFWGDASIEPSYVLTRWLFHRLLGVVYLIAFLSLAVQTKGLVGEEGIAPVGEFLKRVTASVGTERYWQVPTLCWIDPSDASLMWQCYGGAVLAGVLILGVAPVPILVALWALFFSLSTVGDVFLWFQWDTLLLETGLLAIFLGPFRLWSRPSREPSPSFLAIWLIRWLLFRLMFLSGVVKLASGDTTWRDLTALTYHYETQPLPTWTAWYMHHLPLWFHEASLSITFFIELLIPFFIFLPRNLRQFAGFCFVFLMVMIGATGNYNFFNLLTVVLCVMLFDDAFWRRRVSRRWLIWIDGPRPRPRWPMVRTSALAIVGVCIVGLSLVPAIRRCVPSDRWPGWVRAKTTQSVLQTLVPFKSINAYGLFADLTTERPEIVIEGSQDGREWSEYEFHWKPGDVNVRPKFVQPHQPRVDWQMWFAALGSPQRNQWLFAMMRRIQEGSPEVLAFFARNPFPEAPPRYIRAVLYMYHFSSPEVKGSTGAWWRRERLRSYGPVLTAGVPGTNR